ncbi:MAG: hypothetical protein HY287_17060 [Planctomycetes bacterium]|nr:hypothetical protein [Planctomycetota bacterium]
MLLWEHLSRILPIGPKRSDDKESPLLRSTRLPFDTRCAVITKSGKRCKGRIHKGGEYCALHDPQVAAKRRLAGANPRRENPLSKLPDGYLRRLSTRASVGVAMDRLYREVRLGLVTSEMGGVLFGILTRLMDSGLLDKGRPPKSANRSRADRIRPKLADLIARAERAAWERAVSRAPVVMSQSGSIGPSAGALAGADGSMNRPMARKAALDQSAKLTLHAAS